MKDGNIGSDLDWDHSIKDILKSNAMRERKMGQLVASHTVSKVRMKIGMISGVSQTSHI